MNPIPISYIISIPIYYKIYFSRSSIITLPISYIINVPISYIISIPISYIIYFPRSSIIIIPIPYIITIPMSYIIFFLYPI